MKKTNSDTGTPYMTLIETPIGLLYAGCTHEGRICHLHALPPGKSTLIKTHPSLELLEKALKEYFAGRPNAFSDLAIELPHRGFSEKVLQCLHRVPYGSTLSYSQLAALSGHPKAVRAAASVVAANRLLILIPCHRVIRGDGSIGQYALGSQVKQQLLDLESP